MDQKGKLWWPGDHSTICRSHFVDSDYEDKTKAGTLACMGSNIVLTAGFVPTDIMASIFGDCSDLKMDSLPESVM